MTDARWADVQDDLERAVRHYDLAVQIYEAGGLSEEPAPSIDAARRLASSLWPSIEAFRDQIDPPDEA